MSKKELYSDLVCALTHSLITCDECKKCKGCNSAEIRMNLVSELADYMEAKPTTVLQATKNDEFVGNTTIELDKPFWGQISSVLINGEPLTDFKREINIPKDSKVEIIHYTEFELQRALDKACELLEHFDSPTVRVDKRTKKEWREWLLKDENS